MTLLYDHHFGAVATKRIIRNIPMLLVALLLATSSIIGIRGASSSSFSPSSSSHSPLLVQTDAGTVVGTQMPYFVDGAGSSIDINAWLSVRPKRYIIIFIYIMHIYIWRQSLLTSSIALSPNFSLSRFLLFLISFVPFSRLRPKCCNYILDI